MNLPAYARAAARLLRGTPQPDYFPSAAARARRLSTIERALAAKQRRKRWVRHGAVTAAAAVFVVALVAIVSRVSSTLEPGAIGLSVVSRGAGTVVTDATGAHALTELSPLLAGDTITTMKRGGAIFQLTTGTRLELGNEGHISVASMGPAQRFRLAEGALDAKVAKLKPGERFIIETFDATVEVRGTAFRVTVLEPGKACAGGVRTRVVVTEGVVNVKWNGKSVDVRAGASWPAQCEDEPQAVSTDTRYPTEQVPPQAPRSEPIASRAPVTELLPRHGAPAPAAAAEEQAEAESPRRVSLSDQNDSFKRAVRARQSGDFASALRLYRDFVQQFPASPLAQNARVEVMRLLARSNRAAAAKAASDYLNRYPTGFAREEAERIVAGP